MLIDKEHIEKRNIVESVDWCIDKITEHYAIDRVIADWGIKVMGEVPTYADLPLTAGDNFGDAYLAKDTNDYWVWTRANPLIGKDNNYWLNVGSLAIPGPMGLTGATGPTGATGERGNKWFSGTEIPSTDGKILGDMFLNSSDGTVYQLLGDSQWVRIGSILGPRGIPGIMGPKGDTGERGPAGEKGATGDVGGFINVAGIITSTSQLPNPQDLGNLTYAYLLGTTFPYDLYIQAGASSEVAEWVNTGPLNVSTLVSVNGQYQNTWDADTKVDKVAGSSSSRFVYGVRGEAQTTIPLVPGTATAYTIPERNARGEICTVCTDESGNDKAVNKAYLNSQLNNKLSISGNRAENIQNVQVFGREHTTGEPTMYNLSVTNTGYSVARRFADGRMQASEPTGNDDVVNLSYANRKYSPKLYTHIVTVHTTENNTYIIQIPAIKQAAPFDYTLAQITNLGEVIAQFGGQSSPRFIPAALYVNKLNSTGVNLVGILDIYEDGDTLEYKITTVDGGGDVEETISLVSDTVLTV